VRIGSLRHRVEIQQYDGSKDALNQPVENWTTVGTRWAEVKPLSGREFELAKQMHSETTHQIQMRYAELDSSMRLVHEGRIYNLLSIINTDQRNIELVIMAKEASG